MEDLLLFIAVGFAAQIVDGAVGMAYGLSATTVLLSVGVTPAVASATVHAAEVFTTGASGFAHWRLGNVRKELFWRLVLPGMVGGGLGAYLLASVPTDAIRPIVAGYLLVMGLVILGKALRGPKQAPREVRHAGPLGFIGALLDAIGGGGWGPMVTGTLMGRGLEPRLVIGTANAAEFFVTVVISVTFLGTIGLELWPMIVGLIVGGVAAAPFGALLAKQLPDRALMILVGVVIMILSVRNLILHFS
jgi:hypothetical protein